MESILEVKNITKIYKKNKSKYFTNKEYQKAVNNVSFNINKGEVFGLVGESGCGKSTLASIIIRLIKDHEGQIYFEGKDITNYTEKDLRYIRKNIQIIFQNSYASLNPKKKVDWILRESLILEKKLSKEEKNKKVDEVLDMVGLNQTYKNRYPYELSGGERQRISIASAIILKPKIIIADEAVSSLDVSISAQILNIFMELKERLNLSYIFISHDLNLVNFLSDRVAVMYKGEIVELATTEEICKNPKHNYTKKLYSSQFTI